MENRRVQMTKRLLKEALLELLDEKPLEKISVTDVCRRADVNRSTFYAHYMDTTALLHEMEQEVFSELPGADFLPVDVHDQRFFDALESFFTYVHICAQKRAAVPHPARPARKRHLSPHTAAYRDGALSAGGHHHTGPIPVYLLCGRCDRLNQSVDYRRFSAHNPRICRLYASYCDGRHEAGRRRAGTSFIMERKEKKNTCCTWRKSTVEMDGTF